MGNGRIGDAEILARISGSAAKVNSCNFESRHFSVAEIARLWNLSEDSVRRIFLDEPGVLVLGDTKSNRHKRRYRTLRIPEPIVERVYRRLSVESPHSKE
jgi:hypothetical protein